MADAILLPSDASSWSKFVTDFDNTKSRFMATYQNLIAQQNYVYSKRPDLKARYDALVKQGASNLQTIQFLSGVRDSVNAWLRDVQSAQDTVSQVWQNTENAFNAGVSNIKKLFGLGALGFAPIAVGISVVAASAALAFIVKWIADAVSFSQRINAEMKLIDKGYTPEAAANAVNKIMGSSASGLFGVPWKWILIGGVALVAVPMVLRMVRK